MNTKKKLKSMKPQNIGLPSGFKIYINESLCKYYKYMWWKCSLLQTRGSIQSFWVKNESIRIRQHLLLIMKTWNVLFWKKIFVTTTMMEILQIKWILFYVVAEMFCMVCKFFWVEFVCFSWLIRLVIKILTFFCLFWKGMVWF